MVERLHRLERLHVENPLYFVTFCTDSRKELLACEPVHEAFRGFCIAAMDRQVFVGRYILMPDHVHLFVRVPPPSQSLSKWIKSLKNTLSAVLRHLGSRAPHWQKGFFDHVLRSRESDSQKWRYIVENSMRKQLAAALDDWPYQGEICVLETDHSLQRP
jgi:REP element-mobilizing transposase RayT